MAKDWYDVTREFHTRTFAHDCALSSLPAVWERELAAVWRLEADVNNGAYPQFICNWGRESYEYASQALNKMEAKRMAKIVHQCQALIDEHYIEKPLDYVRLNESVPLKVLERIAHLSYEFMDYPDDIASLGMRHYQQYIRGEMT